MAKKGELSSAQLDRAYPHQSLPRADLYTCSNCHTLRGFCIGVSLASCGHRSSFRPATPVRSQNKVGDSEKWNRDSH
jgi:hypothetical protein